MNWTDKIALFMERYEISSILSDSFDFIIIALMIYCILYFLRGTKSANVLFGITTLLAIAALLAKYLNLMVLGYLLDSFWPILGVAIVVIFQPELRRAFAQAGSWFVHNDNSRAAIDEVVNAVVQMSASKTGALIVFERNIGLAGIINSSVKLDAKVNSQLLQTIFFKNSPLHDCAVIIRKDRIVAAHAVLPLTQEDAFNPAKRLGTRHRAGVGITEETDALALVVSEESGLIAIANKGRLLRGFTKDELRDQLNSLLQNKSGFVHSFSAASSAGRIGMMQTNGSAGSVVAGGEGQSSDVQNQREGGGK